MTRPDLKNTFLTAMASLHANEAAFVACQISSVDHAHAREAAIATAMAAMAGLLGVHLSRPLLVNSLGEFSLVALKEPGADPRYGCGHFGPELARLLTRHKARTGASGPATLLPENGWCKLNHFEAEALVRSFETSGAFR